MKLPRELYGRDLARILCERWAYRQVNQSVATSSADGRTTPDHKPLRIGTLSAILRQVAAAKGVTREDLLATLG